MYLYGRMLGVSRPQRDFVDAVCGGMVPWTFLKSISGHMHNLESFYISVFIIEMIVMRMIVRWCLELSHGC